MWENKAADFSISGVRTVRVHSVCSCRTNVFWMLCLWEALNVSSPISDSLYANSRTLDIGKACRLIFPHPLILWREWCGTVAI